MDSQSPDAVQPSVIPALTVTSSDDVFVKERKDAHPEGGERESGSESRRKENIIKRPTDLTMQSRENHSKDRVLGLVLHEETTKAMSYPSTPLSVPSTPEMEHLPLPRPRSTSALAIPTLLSPGVSTTEYESERDTSSQPVSDMDELDSTHRPKVKSGKDHADSDPTETLTPKKAKKSIKSLKSSFKTSQKKHSDVPSKKGVVGELALSSVKVTLNNANEAKADKVKRRKSKENRKKKLSKMAQKFSEKQVEHFAPRNKKNGFVENLPIREHRLPKTTNIEFPLKT